MPTLLNRTSQPLAPPKTRNKQENTASSQHSSISRPICPCCSETLLRHLDSSHIYWRCSYCHQEMPVVKFD